MSITRRQALVAVLLGTGIAALGCAGLEGLKPVPIPDEKRDYVGTWTGSDVTMTIGADGMFTWRHAPTSGATTEVNAPIRIWHASGFDVGVGPLVTTYVVDEPPRREGDRWHLTVEGHALTR